MNNQATLPVLLSRGLRRDQMTRFKVLVKSNAFRRVAPVVFVVAAGVGLAACGSSSASGGGGSGGHTTTTVAGSGSGGTAY